MNVKTGPCSDMLGRVWGDQGSPSPRTAGVRVLPAEMLLHRKGWAAGHCVGATTPCITLTPCPRQPAGDELSQELKRVKNELERVKGELGTWGWLFRGLWDTRNPGDTPCTGSWCPGPAALWG